MDIKKLKEKEAEWIKEKTYKTLQEFLELNKEDFIKFLIESTKKDSSTNLK